MSRRSLKRRLLRLELELDDDDVAMDFTGMTAEQILAAAARTPGLYEKIVAAAQAGRTVRMEAPAENEAVLPAAGQGPAEQAGEPPPAEPAPAAETPPKQKAYWEEVCRWRLRGPEDYIDPDDKRVGYEADHEYDPFERP